MLFALDLSTKKTNMATIKTKNGVLTRTTAQINPAIGALISVDTAILESASRLQNWIGCQHLSHAQPIGPEASASLN